MNVLILAAGEVSAQSGEAQYPVWLGEHAGELLLERQVKALMKVDDPHLVFAFRTHDLTTYNVGDIARQLQPDCGIVEIKRKTAGAACTALLAIAMIDPNEELIVTSATDIIDVDYAAVVQEFRDCGADAGVLTFDSLHPRYSYVRVDEDGWVFEAAEKRPFSRFANAGFYWYKRGGDFFSSTRRMIIKDAHVNGIFYISPSLNELVLKQMKIARHALDPGQYHPIKTDRQVEAFGNVPS